MKREKEIQKLERINKQVCSENLKYVFFRKEKERREKLKKESYLREGRPYGSHRDVMFFRLLANVHEQEEWLPLSRKTEQFAAEELADPQAPPSKAEVLENQEK